MTTIEKDTILEIEHQRKGKVIVVALQTFDTFDEFWPVAVGQEIPILGMSAAARWGKGDALPCRGRFVKSYKVIEPKEQAQC